MEVSRTEEDGIRGSSEKSVMGSMREIPTREL
jgi:hypothetical protein